VARYTAGFAEIGLRDTATVGGKGASLGELSRAGVPVPPGFVVTTAAFGEALAAVDRSQLGGLDAANLDNVGRVCADLRRRVEQVPIPAAVRDAVVRGCRELGDTPVAVRSSATSEDSADASFAGLQDTYLWVRGEESVLGYLRRCWASLYNVESVTYRLRRRLPEDGLAMGVVVQRMVDARSAGVMFTRSPLTGDRSVVAVEAAWGLGSALVSGEVTPDRFVVNKVTGEVVKRDVATKLRRHRLHPSGAGVLDEEVPDELRDARCLTDDELAALVDVAKRIEAYYGTPQDIEWALAVPASGGARLGQDPASAALSPDGLFVLQSRPETVWTQREAGPVVKPRASAFDHVLHVLGGGHPDREVHDAEH
jgi:pyruvate,water dikinase